jgi:uncharacterized protein YndB with AHSA1/START domain
MTDLTLERHFPVAPEMVFEHLTKQEHLKDWLGPVTMRCVDIDMNLTADAKWYAVIENSEGQTHKMSGQVTNIDPPHTVDFTWGWHDDKDARGHESNVRFQVLTDGGEGSIFKLIHTNLPDEEAAQNHNMGWTSTLTKLEAILA